MPGRRGGVSLPGLVPREDAALFLVTECLPVGQSPSLSILVFSNHVPIPRGVTATEKDMITDWLPFMYSQAAP